MIDDVLRSRPASTTRAGQPHLAGPRRLGTIAWTAALALLLSAGTVALLARATAPSHHAPPPAASAAAKQADSWSAVPLLAQAAISRALGRDERAYWARAAHGRIASFENPRQGLSARFGPAGLLLHAARGQLTLGLRAVAGERARPSAPLLQANRISYRRGDITEWYANGPLGIEQGFDVARPAAGAPDGSLTLGLQLGGSLRAHLLPDGRGLALNTRDGRPVLRYDGLRASDRTGRALPTSMTLDGAAVEIHVNTAGARYPLSIDPSLEAAQLSASGGGVEEGMGTSVAIDGSTVVVGAPSAKVGSTLQGAAYVFVEPAGGWANATQNAELVASDPDSNIGGDELGASVAISGQTIVASAPRKTAGERPYAGELYVFLEPAEGGWKNATQNAELAASDAQEYDYLGTVATDGQTIVAGEANADGPGQGDGGPGAIYVFSKPGGGWTSATQTAKLTASDAAASDDLGTSVALSGTTIVGGAPYAKVGAHAYQGGVYLYTEPSSGGWQNATESAKLTVAAGLEFETLGTAVATDGKTVVAGAANNANPGSAPSSTYVFSKPAGGWEAKTTAPVARLTPSEPLSAEHFGGSVGISGQTIVVGSQFAAFGGKSEQGAVYEFAEPAGGWTTATQTLKLSAPEGSVQQAQSVGISSGGIVETAPYANSQKGAAYVLTPGGSTSEEPKKEPTPEPKKETTFTPAPGNTTLTFTSTAPPVVQPENLGFPLNVPPGQPIACDGNECTYAVVKVKCSSKLACAGVANLEAVTASEASAGRHKTKSKATVYAKVSFTIPAGKSGSIRLKLDKQAHRALAKSRKLRARLTITVKAAGKQLKSSRIVTLKPPRHHR